MIGRAFVRFVARRPVGQRTFCKTSEQPKVPALHPGQFTDKEVEEIHRMLEKHRNHKLTASDFFFLFGKLDRRNSAWHFCHRPEDCETLLNWFRDFGTHRYQSKLVCKQ